MTVLAPPGFMQNLTNHSGEVLRSAFNGLIAGSLTGGSLKTRGGIHPSVGGGFGVTQNGTPNMTVNVAGGQAFVPGSEGSRQGVYDVVNDGTVNLALTAADPSNPRIDLVVLRVRDQAYSGASNDALLAIVTGTPAGSPAPPAAPANSLILAQLSVSAGDTSIVTGDISDQRVFLTAVGGIHNVSTNTTRDAIAGASSGMHVHVRSTEGLDYWNGTVWRPRGISRLANSAAMSTQGWGLVEGLYADAADVDHPYRHNGTTWMPVAGLNVVETVRTAGDWVVAAGAHDLLATSTFTAVAGVRYRASWQSRGQTSNTANQGILHIRHVAGGSITVGATSVGSRQFSCGVAAQDVPITMSKTFVATTSGTYTVGITLNFFSGVGTSTIRSNANDESVLNVDVARQS